MATSYLPDNDHVVRHCPSQLCIHEGDQVVRIFPQAFLLRDGESYLSASWLEFFSGSRDQRLTQVIKGVANARTVRPRHGFAIGNVGKVKDACGQFGHKVRIIHEPHPKKPNPAYTAIRRYKSDEIELLELLAGEVWSDVVTARTYLANNQDV